MKLNANFTHENTSRKMSKEKTPAKTIETLYSNIKQVIEEARNTVYRTANFAMVQAYWNIGKLIVEEEQSGKQRA